MSYPLTRSMCAPVGDGAAAALLCSEDYLKQLPAQVQNRAVKISASVLSGGKSREFDEPSLSRIAAEKAYRMAGIGPEDIDVAEVHDASSFCEVYQMEMIRRHCPGRKNSGKHLRRAGVQRASHRRYRIVHDL